MCTAKPTTGSTRHKPEGTWNRLYSPLPRTNAKFISSSNIRHDYLVMYTVVENACRHKVQKFLQDLQVKHGTRWHELVNIGTDKWQTSIR